MYNKSTVSDQFPCKICTRRARRSPKQKQRKTVFERSGVEGKGKGMLARWILKHVYHLRLIVVQRFFDVTWRLKSVRGLNIGFLSDFYLARDLLWNYTPVRRAETHNSKKRKPRTKTKSISRFIHGRTAGNIDRGWNQQGVIIPFLKPAKLIQLSSFPSSVRWPTALCPARSVKRRFLISIGVRAISRRY